MTIYLSAFLPLVLPKNESFEFTNLNEPQPVTQAHVAISVTQSKC